MARKTRVSRSESIVGSPGLIGSPILEEFRMPGPMDSMFVREEPRTAGRGRVFFDEFGRPLSIRNAPNVRRIKKKRASAAKGKVIRPTLRL